MHLASIQLPYVTGVASSTNTLNLADPEALRDPRPSLAAASIAGAGVVRTINPNQMITVTGDSIGSAFDGLKATTIVGTVTVTV